MEKAKKSTKKKKAGAGSEKTKQTYIEYMLEHGRKPASIYKFCKSLGIKEEEFYQSYGSFEALDKTIWSDYATSTIHRLNADKSYASFGAREKVLAFYFTLIEELTVNRSFALFQLQNWKLPALAPSFMLKFKKEFDNWASEVLEEGKSANEIAKRPFLDKRYGPLLWIHLQFILQFWAKDDSPGFEKTDEAIEKSVNLAFDLIGNGIVDNAFDFGKFLFQQARI